MNRAQFLCVILLSIITPLAARADHPVCTVVGSQDHTTMGAGDSSVAIAWRDNRNAPGNPYDIYAVRLGYTLEPTWSVMGQGFDACPGRGEQGSPSVALGPDGTTWLAWEDFRLCAAGQVWLQGVSKAGTPICPTAGQLVRADTASCRFPMLNPAVMSTQSGATYVVWQRRYDTGVGGMTYDEIRAQHVSSTCSLDWGTSGVLVHQHGMTTSTTGQLQPSIIPDASGGFIAVWSYGSGTTNARIYAKRVNSAGTSVWATTMRVCTTEALQLNHSIASDGAGGVIVVWQHGSAGTRTIRAQRLSADGVRMWTDAGLPIANSGGDLTDPQLVRSTLGRSFVIWQANYTASNSDLFAQRINLLGDTLSSRIVLCNASYAQTVARAAQGPDGSCYVVWQDARDIATTGDDAHIYAQTLDANGVAQCTPNGSPFAAAAGFRQFEPRIVAANVGGSATTPGGAALVLWTDNRLGDNDLFAAAFGTGCTPGVLSVNDASGQLRAEVSTEPNPFVQSTRLRFECSGTMRATIRVHDVAGRVVRTLATDEEYGPGEHLVKWDGRTDSGVRARPGVYLCRVVSKDRVRTGRVMMIR